MLEAAPEVALPPVVLPDTRASPLSAHCCVLFWTVAMLLLVMVITLLSLKVTWLLELGPVLLIVPKLLPPPAIPAAAAAAAPALLRVPWVLVVLEFMAAPVVALPPVVLCLTLASPVEER